MAAADPGPQGECRKPRLAGGQRAAGRSVFPVGLSASRRWRAHFVKKPRLREVEGWAPGEFLAELSWNPGLLTPLGLSPFPCLDFPAG